MFFRRIFGERHFSDFYHGLLAQQEGPAVPIEEAPHHLPVFKNESVTVLKIDVPPQRNTGFHIHATDSVSVNIEEADMFSPSSRADVSGYTEIMDNERVRGRRLCSIPDKLQASSRSGWSAIRP